MERNMKSILINLAFLLLFAAMYYFNFWNLFTFKYAFFYAFGLVIIIALIGLKLMGNPFKKGNNND